MHRKYCELRRHILNLVAAGLLILFLVTPVAGAGSDWPMWRANIARSGATPQALPDNLYLQWSRQLPPLEQPWPHLGGLDFGQAYQPVIESGRVFIASSHDNSVRALDLASGAEVWRFYADGPVYFAPVIDSDRLYFGADDGYIYALDARSGSLIWKHRPGPPRYVLLGNGRPADMWPVRGAPVVADGVVYAAAGIWPFMGVIVTALDAETGAVIWQNDDDQSRPVLASDRIEGGLSPQGYLAIMGDILLIPNGRAVPAALDRVTGRQAYFRTARSWKQHEGGFMISADPDGRHWFNSGIMYERDTGNRISLIGHRFESGSDQIPEGNKIYVRVDKRLRAFNLDEGWEDIHDRLGRQIRVRRKPTETWAIELDTEMKLHLKAGPRLYLSRPGTVAALTVPPPADAAADFAWQAKVSGTPAELIAAGNRLLVTTHEGMLYCFGPQDVEPRHIPEPPPSNLADNETWRTAAAEILRETGVNEGWTLALGVGSGELIMQLLSQSDLQFIVMESDTDKANRFRDRTLAAGFSAARITTITGQPGEIRVAPYLASLVVSETPVAAAGNFPWSMIFQSLRPFGGIALLPLAGETDTDALIRQISSLTSPQGKVSIAGNDLKLARPGPLPGTADWNDHGNSFAGGDTLVAAPLGILWFGDHYGPNYRKSPIPPLVAGGRLLLVADISGRDLREAADPEIHPRALRAQDVYSGRPLWQIPFRQLPDGEEIVDRVHLLAAGDDVYLVHKQDVFHIDAERGKLASVMRLPAAEGQPAPEWTQPLLWENLLVGITDSSAPGGGRLVAIDRHSGHLQWNTDLPSSDRLVAGNGVAYILDRTLTTRAFDLLDGSLLWERSLTDEEAPLPSGRGTHLAYSEETDILVQSDRRVNLYGRRGRDGKLLWHHEAWHTLPLLLVDDKVIWTVYHSGTALPALNQFTGEVAMRRHPLTDKEIPWSFTRNYGCNRTLYASKHLFTFRSGTAGFFDLKRDGGTGNLTGFRSGCRNNLLPANGVLSAVEMSGGCYCSYPLQTSVAFIHMPDVDFWTMTPSRQEIPDMAERNERMGDQTVAGIIRTLGLNLGAPGNRRDDNGLLWLNVAQTPLTSSPGISLELETGEAGDWWRKHSFRMSGDGWPWVISSGIEALDFISVDLAPEVVDPENRNYTVRLHFAEPVAEPGQRIFDVRVQDRTVLAGLDIAAETGGIDRGLTRVLNGINVRDTLKIELIPAGGQDSLPPVLSGLDITLED